MAGVNEKGGGASAPSSRAPGEYSVCQFFPDGSYEYVRRFVQAEEAVEAFKHYTRCVAARMGVTERVIITDALDCIAMEWTFEGGLIFPTKEELASGA